MNLVKPKNLMQGDNIEIVAPAGVVEYEEIMTAKDYLESLGFNITLGKHIFNSKRYLAGDDVDRLEDLHKAFLNNNVNAILCARGGYGSLRLINNIDYEIIRNNPKIFCGYSDITILSLMFLKKAGLITYSAPMAQSDFNSENPDSYTQNSFLNVLKGRKEIYTSTSVINYGESEGILWGGNLSSIVSLCGTDFIPDTDFIFFAEDLNEPAYKIDKMLQQLYNVKDFKKHIKGVAFGEFLNCDNEAWLTEIFKEFADTLNIPAYSGFNITHDVKKQTVPIGVKVFLDGNITILD